jgi:hypothetical protein
MASAMPQRQRLEALSTLPKAEVKPQGATTELRSFVRPKLHKEHPGHIRGCGHQFRRD